MSITTRAILLAVLLHVATLGFSQTAIDYKSNPLLKELKRYGINDFSELKEAKVRDERSLVNTIQGKFFVPSLADSPISYIYVGRVNSCRAGGCSSPAGTLAGATSEYFDYFILFNRHKAVQQVRVFNYRATHGHEITARGWLRQFVGYNGSSKLQVNKNVDAIAGATISVHAITADIESKTDLLNTVIK